MNTESLGQVVIFREIKGMICNGFKTFVGLFIMIFIIQSLIIYKYICQNNEYKKQISYLLYKDKYRMKPVRKIIKPLQKKIISKQKNKPMQKSKIIQKPRQYNYQPNIIRPWH